MDTDNTFVVQLYGNINCHACSRPATWWVERMTFPCRCGVGGTDDLEFAVHAIASYPEIKAARDLRVKMVLRPSLEATIDALAAL